MLNLRCLLLDHRFELLYGVLLPQHAKRLDTGTAVIGDYDLSKK